MDIIETSKIIKIFLINIQDIIEKIDSSKIEPDIDKYLEIVEQECVDHQKCVEMFRKQNIKLLDGTYLHEIIDITEEGVSSYINYIDESLPFKNKYGIFAFAFYVYRYKNNKVIKYKKIEFIFEKDCTHEWAWGIALTPFTFGGTAAMIVNAQNKCKITDNEKEKNKCMMYKYLIDNNIVKYDNGELFMKF